MRYLVVRYFRCALYQSKSKRVDPIHNLKGKMSFNTGPFFAWNRCTPISRRCHLFSFFLFTPTYIYNSNCTFRAEHTFFGED